MLALLLCLISVTRTTIAYFTGQFFNKDRGSRAIEADTEVSATDSASMQEQDCLDQVPSTSSGSAGPQRKTKSSRMHVADAAVTTQGAYEVEEHNCYPHLRKPQPPVKLPVEKDATHYNMSHRLRGKCLVFNHTTFGPGMGPPREGSSVDVDTVEKAFTMLGFDVQTCPDYTYDDIMDAITHLSDEDHNDADCVCVFVMTHGHTNGMIYAKDRPYETSDIWRSFTADNCSSLTGKPKLFFFQACRGTGSESGVEVYNMSISVTDSAVSTAAAAASYKLPTHADFLFGFSTMEDFPAWRDPKNGAWYIQTLCGVINDCWETTDLLKMMTITARKVATEYITCNDDPAKHEQKQMPSLSSTLTRDLIFTPKNK